MVRAGARSRIALGVLVAVGAVAASAYAAPAWIDVFVAKHKDGPYHPGNTSLNANQKGNAKSLFFRGDNTTNDPITVTVEDLSSGQTGNFKLRWFRGNHDITSDVKGAGYEFTLNVSKTFRALLKPRVNNPGQLCVALSFSSEGDADPVALAYVNSGDICG